MVREWHLRNFQPFLYHFKCGRFRLKTENSVYIGSIKRSQGPHLYIQKFISQCGLDLIRGLSYVVSHFSLKLQFLTCSSKVRSLRSRQEWKIWFCELGHGDLEIIHLLAVLRFVRKCVMSSQIIIYPFFDLF